MDDKSEGASGAASDLALVTQRRTRSFAGPEDRASRSKLGASLLRSWWIVVLATAAGLASSAYFAEASTPTFRARTTLVVGPNQSLQAPRDIVDSLDTLDRRSVVATFAMLPPSTIIRHEAQEQLRLRDSQFNSVSIRTAVVPDSNVLEVTVDGPDARTVRLVADAIAQQTIAYTSQYYSIYGMKVLDRAETPLQPVGASLLRRLLAGGFLGFLMGIAIAWLLYLLRRPVEAPEQATARRTRAKKAA